MGYITPSGPFRTPLRGKMTTISAIRCRFDTGTKFIAARRNVRARATIPKTPRAAFSNKSELSKVVKPTVATILTNAVMVLPSLAGEPGKIFDFNLTLPIIASEFLLLMVILDKTVFGPVGKALDDRDALIRSQLAAVGDNSTEVAKEVASTKAKIDADIAEAQAKAKADVDKQIAAALAKLEAAKAESAAQVETKAKELSDQIIKKVVEV